MSEDKAKAEESLTQAEQDYKATMSELEQLASYAADLHKSCDFTLKNFDIRALRAAQPAVQAELLISVEGNCIS